MKEVLCLLLLLGCAHRCLGETKYDVKPVLFINVKEADLNIADGCRVRVSALQADVDSLWIETANGTSSVSCTEPVTKALSTLVINASEVTDKKNLFHIGAKLNSSDLCKEGVLQHRQGLLNYHCPKQGVNFFFDRITWWALLIVIVVALALVVGSVLACYVDCINRRTSMPESAKDDAERSNRDQANSIRRGQLEKLLQASILRHRMREANAEKAKNAAEYRRAKRAEQRKRMVQAQQEVSERSTESQSHHSSEVVQDGKSRWTKPTECVPLTSLNPEMIHQVIDERVPGKAKEESKQDSNTTDSVEMKPKKDLEASEVDKEEPKTAVASNPEAPRLPISKIAPPSKNRLADRKMDRNDHLIDSIELTKDTRPEVAISKSSSETRDVDEDSVLRTCEEEPKSNSSSPEQS